MTYNGFPIWTPAFAEVNPVFRSGPDLLRGSSVRNVDGFC